MRKSLIITVVITLLCLCGCEAVVTVPESPEPTKASEMLLTTTAAEESTDKLEATTTSSVEIDVPGKNEVYGSETLEENLKFIAASLGGKGSPREVIRNYFIPCWMTSLSM